MNDNDFEDTDELYFWIENRFGGNKPPGHISRSFIKNRLRSHYELSTDWDKKTVPPRNPHQTRARKGRPEKYGVLFFVYGRVITLNVTIVYTPTPENSAHTDVKCNPELPPSEINRLAHQMRDLTRWKINYGDPIRDV